MIKKRLLAAGSMAMATVLIGAGISPIEVRAGDKVVVGMVQIDLTNPFHLGEVEGAKECAERNGFEIVITSGDGDVTKQVEAFDNLLEQVDVITVNCIDVTAFANSFQKAKDKGIPVIVMHSKDENTEGTVGFDEYALSTEVGEYAVELLKEQEGELTDKKVAILAGMLGQGLNEGRVGGFADVMEANGIEILAAEPTDWDGTKAVTIMENYLTAYDQIDLIYGLSDSVTYPAAQVIADSGRDILVTSVDGNQEAIQAVIDGEMDCTYLLAAEYTGYYKALIPYQVLTEDYDLSEDYILPGFIVTSENAEAILSLCEDMVNKTNEFPFEKPLTEIVDEYMAD
ncbi:MAG: sugar ABC transporter substrate-binding protein [Eubacteriales bacterium]|nr:sugar ABC transporter substrate-binding protein [Eubacteriales bacterium]